MLVRKRPETIASTVTIKGQGEEMKFNVTYYNRTQEEVEARVEDGTVGVGLVLYVTQDITDTQPGEGAVETAFNEESLTAVEKDRPGFCMAIMQGFYKARVVEQVKN